MAASPPPAPGRIFISYRREETAFPAGWLYDRLAERFTDGQVFKDVDSIELGDDFVEVISTAVGSCDVLLALIGHQWLTITDEDGHRRLEDPNDFVRVEIEAALARNVRVIPILVEGARMPRATELPPSLARLVRRQALELHPSRFDFDTGRLLRVLERTLAEVRTAQDAVVAKAPADAPPEPTATELPKEPVQHEQTTPTAGITSVPAPPAATPPTDSAKSPEPSTTELPRAPQGPEEAAAGPTASVLPAAPATPAAARPPTDPGKPRASSSPEVQQASEQQEQATPTPTAGIASAVATPAATVPPKAPGKPRGMQRRPLSARSRILAGAGIGVVLILVIVAIVVNSRTTGSVIFEDDFSRKANGWDDAGPQAVGARYASQAYKIHAEPGTIQGGSPKGASSVYPSAPAKLSIQVDAQRLTGERDTWYGISCRGTANSLVAYVFLMGDGLVEIGKQGASGSAYQMLKRVEAPAIDADAKNRLDADCIGNDDGSVHLRFAVNDASVEWTDTADPLPTGTVALFATSEANAKAVEVQFDNFVVSQL